MNNKIWYVSHPISQFKEDVKQLAKNNNLRIVDSLFQCNNPQCENAPKLTLVGEVEKPKTKAKKED